MTHEENDVPIAWSHPDIDDLTYDILESRFDEALERETNNRIAQLTEEDHNEPNPEATQGR